MSRIKTYCVSFPGGYISFLDRIIRRDFSLISFVVRKLYQCGPDGSYWPRYWCCTDPCCRTCQTCVAMITHLGETVTWQAVRSGTSTTHVLTPQGVSECEMLRETSRAD